MIYFDYLSELIASKFDYPYNLIFVFTLFVMSLLYYVNRKSINEWITIHRKILSYLLVVIVLLLILFFGLLYIHDRYYFPEPSENQIVVAISPFYYTDKYGNTGSNVNTARHIKERLEVEENLKLNIILLDEPIYDIEDAKFQGQKVGAHLIVYGETLETPGGIEEVICYILPLPSIENIIPMSPTLITSAKNNIIIEKATFTRFTENPVEITESLAENTSSAIYTISALERYINSDYTSAIKFFKAIRNYENNSLLLFYIGVSYHFENNINEAIETYNKSLKINPQYMGAWYNKGIILSNLGRNEEALITYNKTIEINSQHVGAWNNKGATLSNLGRFEEALVAYDRAVEICPQYAEAWNNKGGLLTNLGRFEEALIAYDKAIKINPQYAEAWSNKGATLSSLGRFEEALISCDEAIKINPQHIGAWNNKGVTLWRLGQFEEALIVYDEAIKIDPQYAEAWYNKGGTLSSLGRNEEALIAYDKAVKINPRYAET